MTTKPADGRHIDVGAVVSRVFDTYGKTASVLIPGALIVFVPVALVAAATRDSTVGSLLASILSLVASTWYAGMVVKAVQDVQDGQLDNSIGELFSSVTPVLGTLILVSILAAVGIFVGIILCIIPGLVLLTIWAVAAPVVVVENPGVTESLSRSRELVRGNGWQVFGVIVVIFAILLVISIVIGAIGAIGDSFVLVFLVQLAVSVLIAPIYALAAAVLYYALVADRGGAPDAAYAPPAVTPETPGTDAFGNPLVTPPPPAAPEAPEGFVPPAPPPVQGSPAGDPPPPPAVDAPSPPVAEPPAADPPQDPPQERPPGESIPPPGWKS